MEILERYQDMLRPDWQVFVLLALLIILTLVRIFGRERLVLITSSVLKPRISRQEVREMSEVLDIGYLGLWSIVVFTFGLFIFQELILQGLHPFNFGPFLNYLTICALIAGYFIARFLFIKTSMFFVGEDLGGSEYFYNTFVLFSIAGAALFPLIVFRAYVQWFPFIITLIGLAIFGVAIIYQWARGWIIARGHHAKPIYIIMYFCVLEILPYAIMARFLID